MVGCMDESLVLRTLRGSRWRNKLQATVRQRCDLISGLISAAHPFPDLLYCIICISISKIVFTEVDELRFAMLETNERMLPITYVIAKANVENLVPEIVAVEVEPKRIDNPMRLVHNDEYGWGIASSTMALPAESFHPRSKSGPCHASHPILLAEVIGYVLLPTKPVWSFFDIVIAGQVDMATTVILVELIEVSQVHVLGLTLDWRVIQFWSNME